MADTSYLVSGWVISTLVYCNGGFGTRLAPFRDCKAENDVVFLIVPRCRGDATNDSRTVSQHDASRFSILTKKNCLARKVNTNASSRSFIPRLTYTSIICTFKIPIFHYQQIHPLFKYPPCKPSKPRDHSDTTYLK
jgi:hypothetical protein